MAAQAAMPAKPDASQPSAAARAVQPRSPLPVLEVWGGVTFGSAPLDGKLAATYEPLFSYGVALSSSGSQSLVLTTGRSLGFEGGVALFPSEHGGVELRIERMEPAVGGTSSPHRAQVTYTAMYPPAYQPQVVTSQREDVWADPEGAASATLVSVNAVGRWAAGKAAIVRISGGLTLARVSASVDSIGFAEYRLGGHSVLFSEIKKLEFVLGPSTAVGLNVGAGVDLRLTPHVAIAVDGRWFHMGAVTPEVTFTAVTNATEVIWETDLAAARGRFDFDPCTLGVHRLRAQAGVKILF